MNHDESSPAVAVKTAATLTLSGAAALTLNQWIQLATLIYLLLQIGWLVRKHWRGPAKTDLVVDDE